MPRVLALPLLLACGWAQAQLPPIPTPGAVQDSVMQPRLPQLSSPPEVMFSREPAVQQRAQTQRFLVSGFTFKGNTQFSEALLRQLVEPYLDLQLTLGELDRIADRITAFYRSRGFTVARAYLPAQRVEDGLVTIQIIEGSVESVVFRSEGRYGRAFLDPYVTPLLMGDGSNLVTDARLERQLLLMNDLPGLRARATLAPGQKFGTSMVEIETQDKPVGVSLGANNYGSETTGEHRWDAGIELNNPLRLGDQLSLRVIRSTEQLFAWNRLGYTIPLGHDGLRLGLSRTATDYDLGGVFAPLEISGKVRSADATLSYPFVRSRAKNVIGALQWRQTTSQQRVLGIPFSESKLPLLVGSVYTNWVASDSSANSVSVAASTNALKSGNDSVTGDFGRFLKLDAEWTYLTGAGRNLDFFFRGKYVMATREVPDAEKMPLGGESSVRGYAPSILRGDSGYQMTFELRRQFLLASKPGYAAAFADLGGVKNKGPFLGYDRASSLGVGYTQYLGNYGQFKVELAKPMIRVFDRKQSERIWLSVNLAF
ncbi:MAG: ShlB/FhaC/HecB family hemolysin secretion/activation protein [Burkholderiales bacterium]|nr:ShlB/FhaC/HecB family hemolysin secretion/activation protein [Burkholderiales bacterium]